MLKRLGAALLIVSISTVYGFPQSGRSRPRVVGTPAERQKTEEVPVPAGEVPRKAPTLSGVTAAPSPTPPPAAETEAPAEDDGDVIRVETNLVTFPVSVLDRDGRFISGLRKEDFRIFEDGTEQQIQHFQPVESPFTVLLLLDVSPSTRFKIQEIQDAATAFVDQLRAEDRVMVIAFDEDVRVLCPPTNHRWRLYSAIREVEFGDGTSLYHAVDRVVGNELKKIQGRKAVVLFTDGVDTTSRGSNYQGSLRNVEEADALFYPIRYDTLEDMGGYSNGRIPTGGGGYPPRRGGGGTAGAIAAIIGIMIAGAIAGSGGASYPGSSGGSRSEYETGKRYLEDLARVSGGRKFESGTDLNLAFTGIAEELRRQYSIGYYPENMGREGDRKQIRVRVMRPNLVVRAKTSYVVGS